MMMAVTISTTIMIMIMIVIYNLALNKLISAYKCTIVFAYAF